MKKIIFFIFVSFLVFVSLKMASLETEIETVLTLNHVSLPHLTEITEGDFRQKAIAFDGEIIQGTNLSPQPSASTAKMILGLAIMKEKPFAKGEQGEIIKITPEFYEKYLWYSKNNGSTTKVETGEMITEYDALVSVFLASSNNMADSLAIWAFGSQEEYKAYATSMLAEMGIKNTVIGIDANGYSPTTTSTAEDLAIIGEKVKKDPVLSEIVNLSSYMLPVAGMIENTNKILHQNGISGVKTGYIGDPSGYCLISSFPIENHILTVAILGSSTRQSSFEESLNEVQKLQNELTKTKIIQKNEKIGIKKSWWIGEVDIESANDLEVIGSDSMEQNFSLEGDSLSIKISNSEYSLGTSHEEYRLSPTIIERFLHVFGWEK